jgi:hypothetical protein
MEESSHPREPLAQQKSLPVMPSLPFRHWPEPQQKLSSAHQALGAQQVASLKQTWPPPQHVELVSQKRSGVQH